MSQQHLKLENELRKLAKEVNRDGLPYPRRPEATMALAVAIRDKLQDGSQASRASNAGALVARVFDRTMRKMPEAHGGRVLACKAGCTYCCHNVVMATAPEIFLAASELRAQHAQAFVADVAGRCDATRQSRSGQADGRKSPCPLLHSDLCSVYSARPSVCRKHTSFSVSDCRLAVEFPPLEPTDLVGALRRVDGGSLEVRPLRPTRLDVINESHVHAGPWEFASFCSTKLFERGIARQHVMVASVLPMPALSVSPLSPTCAGRRPASSCAGRL